MIYRFTKGLVRLGLRAFFRVPSWALWLSLVRPSARAMLRRMRRRALARADRLLALVAEERPRIESPGSG